MDARGKSESTPTKHRTVVERKSERELVVTRTVDAPARLIDHLGDRGCVGLNHGGIRVHDDLLSGFAEFQDQDEFRAFAYLKNDSRLDVGSEAFGFDLEFIGADWEARNEKRSACVTSHGASGMRVSLCGDDQSVRNVCT